MFRQLWDEIPRDTTVYGVVELSIRQTETGKPVVLLEFPDGTEVCITAGIAEMLGGAGGGARKRYEDCYGH